MSTQKISCYGEAEWKVSASAMALLLNKPELLESLSRDSQLPPFPPGYFPAVVEVLFDDLPYIRVVDGELIYIRDCHRDFHPKFVEYRFDDEIAAFCVEGEYVINRIDGIAEVVALQNIGR